MPNANGDKSTGLTIISTRTNVPRTSLLTLTFSFTTAYNYISYNLPEPHHRACPPPEASVPSRLCQTSHLFPWRTPSSSQGPTIASRLVSYTHVTTWRVRYGLVLGLGLSTASNFCGWLEWMEIRYGKTKQQNVRSRMAQWCNM